MAPSWRVIQSDLRVPIDRSRNIDPGSVEKKVGSSNYGADPTVGGPPKSLPSTHLRIALGGPSRAETAFAFSMVRNYIRKGGHGGSRRNSGLWPFHWEDQGGRAAAAQAKANREAADAAKAAAQKRNAAQMFQQWGLVSQQKCSKQQQPQDQAAAGERHTCSSNA